jgi:hypothetical protein
MADRAETLGLVVGALTSAKFAMMAIGRYFKRADKVLKESDESSKERRQMDKKQDERLVAIEIKLDEIEKTKGEVTNDRVISIEDTINEIHDCIDRLDDKNQKDHSQMAERLQQISDAVARSEGKLDLLQSLILKKQNEI